MQHDFILLDRSGSMSNLWKEAINSVNGYVKKLADDKVDTGVTLATFDTPDTVMRFEIIRDRIIPSTWKTVAPVEAAPRGWTPLNDAVGKVVDLARSGNYDKVAIIVMTDGQENASKELRVDQAKTLLDDCRARGWQIIFLGADFDNAAQAASYGTQTANTVRSSTVNLGQSMGYMARKRATYAEAAVGQSAGTMDFSEDEKTTLASDKPVDPAAP